jgi:hypothetical protein
MSNARISSALVSLSYHKGLHSANRHGLPRVCHVLVLRGHAMLDLLGDDLVLLMSTA